MSNTRKIFKFPNAKDKLEKNKPKNEELKKYGKVLGKNHPFNKLKEEGKFKDMEKYFIKPKGKEGNGGKNPGYKNTNSSSTKKS